MQITFNTGRMYTNRGQIVTAKFDASTGRVWFNDHSRMCYGSFVVNTAPLTLEMLWADPEKAARCAMRHYDNGGVYDCPIEDYRIARDLREDETVLQYRI